MAIEFLGHRLPLSVLLLYLLIFCIYSVVYIHRRVLCFYGEGGGHVFCYVLLCLLYWIC